jgi:hypothetical protein
MNIKNHKGDLEIFKMDEENEDNPKVPQSKFREKYESEETDKL